MQHGRKTAGETVEKRSVHDSFLRSLDLLPALEHFGGIGALCLAEDVWVSPDELLRDAARHLIEIETSLLDCDLRMKNHLEEKVPEFLAQVGIISGIDRSDNFIRLLQQSAAKGGVRLLAVPRTTTRIPQRRHDGAEAIERRERF
jgi:hypothetical protein